MVHSTAVSIRPAPLTVLRVGTWNVAYARGAAKNRAILDLLQTWSADVWVLTETHNDLDLSASHTKVGIAAIALPSATRVVAGENTNLGGRHSCGTLACRALLKAQMANATSPA